VSLLKLIFCNPIISLCMNSLIVDWRDQSPPEIRSSWTELGKHFWCVCFSSLFIFCLWFCVFHLIPRLNLGSLLLLMLVVTLILVTTFLCSTHHSFIGVILSPNSQQVWFAATIYAKQMQKGYISESPSWYDGILDLTCTFTPSVSRMVVYRKKKLCQFLSCTIEKKEWFSIIFGRIWTHKNVIFYLLILSITFCLQSVSIYT